MTSLPKTFLTVLSAFAIAAALAACGDGGGGGGDGGSNGDGGAGIDANGTGGDGGVNPDAPPGAGACGPDQPQCNNCIDDDGDGLVDGDDPECTGAIDNDEGSFSTGIPGDNIDTKHQDCFFDGNSGAGDDGCNIHTCCILGYDHQQCADAGIASNFDPATDCPAPTQECIDNCGALTPPGCDCFGCCTVCDGDGCADIYINPAIDPDCDQTTIHDPALCTVCTPSTVCGSDCGGDTCVLCPGQDPADLPPSCTTQECPNGAATCDLDHPCPSDTQFCSVGCCISVVQ